KAHFPMYLAKEGEVIPALTLIYDQQLAGGLLKFIQIISYPMALLLSCIDGDNKTKQWKEKETRTIFAMPEVSLFIWTKRKNKCGTFDSSTLFLMESAYVLIHFFTNKISRLE